MTTTTFKRLSTLVLLCTATWASAASPAQVQVLPTEVSAALTRAHVPAQALSVWVQAADGQAPARLSHRADAPMNPASVMKLVTTYAALDVLGPAFVWHTPVWLDGPVENGVLKGNLVIQGQGDPKLVQERLWLLLRRVQGLGVQRIAGHIVLDRQAFAVPASDPGDFDGEPLRPYNAAPDALLLNFKSILLTFPQMPQQASPGCKWTRLWPGCSGPRRYRCQAPRVATTAPRWGLILPTRNTSGWRAAIRRRVVKKSGRWPTPTPPVTTPAPSKACGAAWVAS